MPDLNVKVFLEARTLVIEGALTQKTVQTALEKALRLLEKRALITVDLKGVAEVDSTSVPFLTTLLRESKKRQISLRFIHLPPKILELSKLSGVENLLFSS